MAVERLVSPSLNTSTDVPEHERVSAAITSLRPRTLAEYVGQPDLVQRLAITIQAVRERNEPMEHVLLHGPPGLGKTTLAHVIAEAMGHGSSTPVQVHLTSGPALTRPTDLVRVLCSMAERDVLFIDEIHRLPIAVEEFIYPAMEDFVIDIRVETGMHAQTIQKHLKPFTLIGATTRAGLISSPLRSRFGITHSLRYYTDAEILTILRRSATILGGGGGVKATDPALTLIASRSRGTPRIANRLLRRVRDFAQVKGDGTLTPRMVNDALALEGIDDLGLDELDRSYLRVIAKTYAGGPVGLEAVAATLNHDSGTLEDVVEPYLLQIGFLARTRRGRALTQAGAKHIGMPSAVPAPGGDLFEA